MVRYDISFKWHILNFGKKIFRSGDMMMYGHDKYSYMMYALNL